MRHVCRTEPDLNSTHTKDPTQVKEEGGQFPVVAHAIDIAVNQMEVSTAPTARASCRVCAQLIAKGDLRIALTGSTRFSHARCADLLAVGGEAEVSGFAALSAAHQAELRGFLSPAAQGASTPATVLAVPAAATPVAAAKIATTPGKQPMVIDLDLEPPPVATAPVAATKIATIAKEEPPFTTGISKIEYAKAKQPSPCMLCKSKIRNGEPRVGDQQPSSYYEGLQTRWLCLPCALKSKRISRLSQLAGWDRMGYDCNSEIRTATGELLGDAREAALESAMAGIEELQDAIVANLTAQELVATLSRNGIDARALQIEGDTIAMALVVADGMLHGLCANCPVCSMASLYFAAGRIACLGCIDRLSRCPYRGAPADVQRFRFVLPDEMRSAEWVRSLEESAAPAPVPKGRGKAKAKAPAPKARAGSCALAGLRLAQIKTAGAAPAKPVPPPPRQVPEEGCALLEVHRGFKQTGQYYQARLIVDADGVTVYNAHLNQVDVSSGVNRYYIVQALSVNGRPEVFVHWGAIGREDEEEFGGSRFRANFQRYPQTTEGAAIETFKAWFLKKTNSAWDQRHAFSQTPSYYNFVELSTHAPAGKGGTPSRSPAAVRSLPCPLEPAVASLVSLLFDEDTIINSMQQSGLRVDENFGIRSLTVERLERAFGVLDRLRSLLASRPSAPAIDLTMPDPPALPPPPPAPPAPTASEPEPPAPSRRSKKRKAEQPPLQSAEPPSAVDAADLAAAAFAQADQVWCAKIAALSNDLQQTIPSVDTTRIDTQAKLDQKAETLALLADIVLAQQLLSSSHDKASQAAAAAGGASSLDDETQPLEPHPLKLKFDSLQCELRALAPSDEHYRAIARAVANTAQPHAQHANNLCGFVHRTQQHVELLEVFALDRKGEAAHFSSFDELGGERALLWHGTDISAAAAIVSSGLRIMPHAGGRVGRGIYLADEMAKSGYYTKPSKKGLAVLFLAEAALGTPMMLSNECPALRRAPDGFDSCITESLTCPDPALDVHLTMDGRRVRFATGQAIKTAKSIPSEDGEPGSRAPAQPHTPFAQREYLVYNEAQLRLRYMVKVRI